MVELRETYIHYGLNPIVVPAVEKVLKGIAALKPGEGAGASARSESLVEVIKSFTERGLLRNGRSPKKASHRKTTQHKKRRTTRRSKLG